MKKPDLIFIVPDLHTGGGERVTFEILKKLNNNSTTLFSKTTQTERRVLDLIKHKEINWSKKISSLVSIINYLLFAPKNSVVIVIFTGPYIIMGLINIFLRRNMVAYEHSDINKLYFQGSYIKILLRKLLFCISNFGIKKIFVVSEDLREEMQSHVCIKKRKVFLINNPVTPFLKKINYSLPSSSISKGCRAFIIGRNSPEKRIYEAVSFLKRSKLISEIIVVSDNFSNLEDLKCADFKIDFLPSIDEIKEISLRNDFLFNYCKVESYSLVVAEWLASRLKTISVDVESMIKRWGNYAGFFYVKENDIEGLEEIIKNFEIDRRQIFLPNSIDSTLDQFLKNCLDLKP